MSMMLRPENNVIVGKPLSIATSSLQTVLSKNNILQSLNKKQFEIIITRFNENLEWTKDIEHLCTVHNKGEPLYFGGCVINLDNYGLDIESIFRHIIENYDNLSDITMFCQGRLIDRIDQPMYILSDYYTQCSINSIFGNTSIAYDPPNWRYNGKTDFLLRSSLEILVNFGKIL